jgi:hypothetical protein
VHLEADIHNLEQGDMSARLDEWIHKKS